MGKALQVYQHISLNPNMNMQGPREPRKTLKAAQTVIFMFYVIHSFYSTPVTFLGSVQIPQIQDRKFFSIFV